MAYSTKIGMFRGFSTAVEETTGKRDWTLYDIKLIRQDLLNHFNTRKGERPMRPDFGCSIWDWLFELSSASVRDDIKAEARRICESDSRVNVLSCKLVILQNGVRVDLKLEYAPSNVVGDFYVTFENNQTTK